MPVLQLPDIEQLAHRALSASGANTHHAQTVAQSEDEGFSHTAFIDALSNF
jgi:hypothetical protein